MVGIDRMSVDRYALGLAMAASARSEDPFRRVGAALLREDNTVAALGYNGAPPKVEIDWSDRDTRRQFVIHAEANALRYVTPGEVALLATTLMPCQNCMLLIAAYRIPRVIYINELDPAIYDRDAILRVASMCGVIVEKKEDL